MSHHQHQPMDHSGSGQNGLPVPLTAIKTEPHHDKPTMDKNAVLVVLNFLKKNNLKVIM